MEAYKNWVRQNKEYLHSLESLANGLTWLLPERFSNSEIGPEAVTSLLGIFTAINQHIIETTPTRGPQPSAPSSSFPYSLCISSLKEVETLVEVVAQQLFGNQKKWNIIAMTEASKVLLRLALFWNSGYKMLLQGGEVLNTESHTDMSDPHDRIGHHVMPGNVAPQGGPGHWNNFYRPGPQERALSALSRFGENARMTYDSRWVNRRIQHQITVTGPQTSPVAKMRNLSSIFSEKGLPGGLFLMGETLFILRPLIYVLFIRKYGIWSWTPWLVSLGVDLVAMGALAQATRSNHGVREDAKINLSIRENDELKRRKLLWALYLMRDPFFCNYTRQKLESTQKMLEPVPVIGLLTEKIVELIFGAQSRYTYMSGS